MFFIVEIYTIYRISIVHGIVSHLGQVKSIFTLKMFVDRLMPDLYILRILDLVFTLESVGYTVVEPAHDCIITATIGSRWS